MKLEKSRFRNTPAQQPTALTTVEGTTFNDTEQWVVDYNGEPVTTSLQVSKVFGKQHKHVIEAIEEHINNMYPVAEENLVADFSAAKYFTEGSYENRGKFYKMYYLTRDGFSLLVMGFNGKQALLWKLQYIELFNKMEEHISTHQLNGANIAAIATQAAVQALTAALPDIIKAVQGSQTQPVAKPLKVADARLAMLPDTLSVKQIRI